MLGDVDGRAGGDGGVVGSALGHGDGGTLSGGTATSGARAAPTWQMAAADADADADADLAELARQKAAAEARAETAEARARWAEDRTADAEDAVLRVFDSARACFALTRAPCSCALIHCAHQTPPRSCRQVIQC